MTLWIAVATVCLMICPLSAVEPKWIETSNFCREILTNTTVCGEFITKTSTSPIVAQSGKTVYQVYPATTTKCDITGHLWNDWYGVPYKLWVKGGSYSDGYGCMICGIQRKMISVKREVESFEWEE